MRQVRIAESHGQPVDASKRLARTRHAGLGRAGGIEPGAVHALERAVVAGHGADQRGEAPPGARSGPVGKRAMKPQCREPAAVNGAGAKIRLGVGVVDGTAPVPEIPGGFGAVVGVVIGSGGRNRLRQEPARLGERLAQRGRSGGEPDEIEQVAVFPGGRVGPFPGPCRAATAARTASARTRRARPRRTSTGPASCRWAGTCGRRLRRAAPAARRRSRHSSALRSGGIAGVPAPLDLSAA